MEECCEWCKCSILRQTFLYSLVSTLIIRPCYFSSVQYLAAYLIARTISFFLQPWPRCLTPSPLLR